MKILLVNNMAPFVWGGAEELVVNLQKQLVLAGHEAEIIRIPFQWEPAERIPSQMLMVRSMELYNVDRVIAFKFPAYLIRHPHKTLWLVHQYRQAYDLYDAGQSNLCGGEEKKNIRNCIINADNLCFSECQSIYTISEITSERLRSYNKINAAPLELPINDELLFKNESYGNYILVNGRINKMKRQALLVDALALTKMPVRLVIAGPADNEQEFMLLQDRIHKYHLENRVYLDIRFLPRSEYAHYLNNALAVACIPFNEEYGYVAREASCAEKAILSTTDSGGILGIAKDKVTGRVVQPTAEALAHALDDIWENRMQTMQYGRTARDVWHEMGINWPNTLEALLR